MAWVGVGVPESGRYGVHRLTTGGAVDAYYAEQSDEIKKKWRAFGSKVQNKVRRRRAVAPLIFQGWSEVRID